MGRVYAVASGKGGVGKTTTVANLGTALAAAGRDVAVVDGDLAMANLAPALGVDPTGATLHDVLAGGDSLDAAVREGPRGLAVVPGATDLDAFARADPDRLSSVLATLRERHDVVLVDTGAGLNTDNVAPLSAADAVLLVSTADRPALAATAKTAAVVDRYDAAVRGVVLVRADGADPSPHLDRAVVGQIPDDDAVGAALDAGRPLVVHAPECPAARAYRRLAATLTDSSSADGPSPARDADASPAGGEQTARDTPASAADDASEDEAASTEEAADDAGGDKAESTEGESHEEGGGRGGILGWLLG